MIKPKAIPSLSDKQIKRFWSRIYIKDNTNECWEWKRKINHSNGYGYGQFCINKQTYRANRIAYLLGKKKNPGVMFVCHTCDNPRCCNPDHLFLGTQKDNMYDCLVKGRQSNGYMNGKSVPIERRAKGERSGARTHPERIARGSKKANAKLTDIQIKEIIELYAKGGISQQKIGNIYGISGSNVGWIVRGKSWTHVGAQVENLEERQLKCKAKLKSEDVIKIREIFVSGKHGNASYLAKLFKVSQPTISNIASGYSWKHLLPKTG